MRAYMRKTLSQERKGHFSSWFHLQPDGAPNPPAPGVTRQSFRPSGLAFQPLVKLDVLVSGAEEVAGAELWIDRHFVDGSNSAFARDIAASFLSWALGEERDDTARTLIANIGDMRAANEPVIMRADAVPPPPPHDRTGCYAVYLGQMPSAAIPLPHARLALENVELGDNGRWLKLAVVRR